jgi:hypothetical protein
MANDSKANWSTPRNISFWQVVFRSGFISRATNIARAKVATTCSKEFGVIFVSFSFASSSMAGAGGETAANVSSSFFHIREGSSSKG